MSCTFTHRFFITILLFTLVHIAECQSLAGKKNLRLPLLEVVLKNLPPSWNANKLRSRCLAYGCSTVTKVRTVEMLFLLIAARNTWDVGVDWIIRDQVMSLWSNTANNISDSLLQRQFHHYKSCS